MTKTGIRTSVAAVLVLLALLCLAVPAMAAETITGPVVITEPGVYRLANDIVDCTAPVCIDIRAGGVTIDGRGHLIDGSGAPGTVGVLVQWTASDAPATIIKNLRLADWGSGIRFYKTEHLRVSRCSLTENAIGIETYCANDVTISSCTLVANGDGISLAGTTGVLIQDNAFADNRNGISLGFGLQVSDGVISLNTIERSSGAGILLGYNAFEIQITSNRITDSGGAGLVLDGGADHAISNNLLSNVKNADILSQTGNAWSRDPVRGKNIVGGRLLGGNYWASPDGKGFSQVTADTDRDGFCDAAYTVAEMNVDRYPLSRR